MGRMNRLGSTDRRPVFARWVGLVLSLVFVTALFVSLPAQAREPNFPAPPNATVAWVGQEMQWGGVDMAARRFETKSSVEKVLEFYKKRWRRGKGGDVGYREAEFDGWEILSRLEDDYMLTVQVQKTDSGGAWGYLGMSNLPEVALADKPPKPADSFPSMKGSIVQNDLRSHDPGQKGRVLALENEFSIEGNVTFYRNHFKADGWNPQVDHPMGPSHVLTYAKRGEQVKIVVQPGRVGKTSIVVNEVDYR